MTCVCPQSKIKSPVLIMSLRRLFSSSIPFQFTSKSKKPNFKSRNSAPSKAQATSTTTTPTTSNSTSLMTTLVVGYLAAVNAGSYALFWWDKQQANSRGWRVSEKTLQFSALMGGWIGGMLAMEHFRHKTVKQEFRIPYFICAGLNGAGLAGLAYLFLSGSKGGHLQAIGMLQTAINAASASSSPSIRSGAASAKALSSRYIK